MVCALIIACFIAVESTWRWPMTGGLQVKRYYLAHTQERFDIIFLGTSVARQNIDATLFADTGSGCTLSAYNAGIPAMTPLELRDYLEAIRSNPHLRQRYLVIDMEIFTRPYLVDDHSFRAGWYKRGLNLDLAWPWFEKEDRSLAEYGRFLYGYFINTIRTGQATVWSLEDPSRYIRAAEAGHAAARFGGFNPLYELPLTLMSERKKRAKMRQLDRTYERGIEGFDSDIPKAFQVMIEIIVSEARQIATPVLLFMPAGEYRGDMIAFVRARYPDLPVLDYNVYDYPAFLDLGMWRDYRHLNWEGADILTQYLYRDFCDMAPSS
ncbi:hypothetical protein B7486_01910 [cyanobacterium TDX16]|nr:hypothetical protein B7486_01910 [cyanobacterium TDX16]